MSAEGKRETPGDPSLGALLVYCQTVGSVAVRSNAGVPLVLLAGTLVGVLRPPVGWPGATPAPMDKYVSCGWCS